MPVPDPTRDTAPTVSTWRDRFGRPFALCGCGWTDKPRWLSGTTVHHALLHAAKTGHMPSQPLDSWKAATR